MGNLIVNEVFICLWLHLIKCRNKYFLSVTSFNVEIFGSSDSAWFWILRILGVMKQQNISSFHDVVT